MIKPSHRSQSNRGGFTLVATGPIGGVAGAWSPHSLCSDVHGPSFFEDRVQDSTKDRGHHASTLLWFSFYGRFH